jgi:hypothetical protein
VTQAAPGPGGTGDLERDPAIVIEYDLRGPDRNTDIVGAIKMILDWISLQNKVDSTAAEAFVIARRVEHLEVVRGA